MNRPGRRRPVGSRGSRYALVLAFFASASLVRWSQSQLDTFAGSPVEREALYLWSGGHLRRLVPGFETIAADIYWLRTVQYFGATRRFAAVKDFTLLRPLVGITTTLDPRLEIAYRYGAIFLSEDPPDGAGRPREGIEILREGIRRLPRSWRIIQLRSFLQYLFLGDSVGAAAVLEEGARRPGAPFWFRTMAADLLAKGGNMATARAMWKQIYAESEAGVLRENAAARLRMYEAIDLADRLTSLVGEYERRTGRRPRQLADLVRAGLWKGALTDARGVLFDYDESSGKVSLSRRSPLWRPL